MHGLRGGVCVFVCVCVCVCVCVVCACMHAFMHARADMHTHVYARTQALESIHLYRACIFTTAIYYSMA